MFELFYYDKKTDEIIIDNAYFFSIPEFKKLWMRVKKIKGDADGRFKLQNKREFMYIYFMQNISKKNPFRLLPENLRHKESVSSCELESNFTPDELLLRCCEIYTEHILTYTPTLKFIVQLDQMIMQAARQVEIIKGHNESLLEGLENQDATMATDTVGLVQLNINRCFDLLAKVSEMQNKKKDLEKKVKDEEESTMNITGGRKIGNRENPNKL